MATAAGSVIVLISSDHEWGVVKAALPVGKTSNTSFGQQFLTQVGDRELVFLHGGWGKIAAAASTQYAIDHFSPQLLVNLGTCGSFHHTLQRGELLLVNKTAVYDIVEQMGDPNEAIDAYATHIDIAWAKELAGVRRGMIISADRDILQRDIHELRTKYDAAAADWESGAIAWTAAANAVPVCILRGVSDVVDETAPPLAYNDATHFEEGAKLVMQRLLAILPECLALWEKSGNHERML